MPSAGHEGAALRDRWEFGRQMLAARDGAGRLPNGYLAGLMERTGKSRAELGHRARFAAYFETEEELANAVSTFGSWHQAVKEMKAQKDADDNAVTEPAPTPEGQFATFVADPPWRYGNTSTRGAAGKVIKGRRSATRADPHPPKNPRGRGWATPAGNGPILSHRRVATPVLEEPQAHPARRHHPGRRNTRLVTLGPRRGSASRRGHDPRGRVPPPRAQDRPLRHSDIASVTTRFRDTSEVAWGNAPAQVPSAETNRRGVRSNSYPLQNLDTRD